MSRRKGRDGRNRRNGKAAEDDEVETLLRAAEDELLLNLKIDSHVPRGSSSLYSLDPDLHRRFQALRSHRKSPPPRQRPEGPSGSADTVSQSEGDLFARFAALKKNNNNNNKGLLDESVGIGSYDNSYSLGIIGKSYDNDEVDEDDEVAKVMRWAVDAARLDPGDDDDDEIEVSSCSTSDDDDDDDEEEDQKRGKEPKKNAK